LLYPKNGQWLIPFTLRPRTLSAHAGQISLPGGAADPGESDQSCALRELHEEIGVGEESLRVLGRLSRVYVYRSDFVVRPFVVLSRTTPVFELNAAEVEQLLEIPVEQLFESERYGDLEIVYHRLHFQAPCISFGCHRIWGATLKVMGEFLDLTEEIFASCRDSANRQ
jgi:8-oxo-dGTP pyrophosphatase MutT (NUDIX family)